MNNEPIKLDFTIPCYLYWYNINASEPWVTATDETLARVGYVPAALLASATARATEAERGLEQTQDAYAKAQECPARLATIVDEAFGVQPVMQFDELLDRLESKLTEMRLDAAEADRERDEALKRVRVSAAKIDDLTETAARVIVERDSLRTRLAAAEAALHSEICTRDRYYDLADELAFAIADESIIGEHTSANNPWANALEQAAQMHKRLTRYAALESAARGIASDIRAGRVEGISELVDESLRAFLATVDALTPSPASEGEQPKGDVHLNDVAGLYDCGACGFSKLSIGAAPCSECVLGGGPDVAPLYFVRRLPLATASESRHASALAQCARVERERDEARAEIAERSTSITRQAVTISDLRVKVQGEADRAKATWKAYTEAADARASLEVKLGEAEKASEQWRSRIATAVGAVNEWDYGSQPGTWEDIEDRCKSLSEQAMADAETYARHTEQIGQLNDRLAAAERVVEAARYWRSAMTPGAHAGLVQAVDAIAPETPEPASEQTQPKCPCGECKHHDGLYCTHTDFTEPLRMQSDDDSPCRRFVAALALAPAKPDTCGECFHVGGIDGCKFVGVNPPPRSYGPSMKACEHFTRRLPVVQPALGAPCGSCCYDGEEDCIHADGEASDPACPGFKEAIPVVDATAQPCPATGKRCGGCAYRNTIAAPGRCSNVFAPHRDETRADDAEACDMHSAKWLCGKCQGMGVKEHFRLCPLRGTDAQPLPVVEPARTCGECHYHKRIDSADHVRHCGNVETPSHRQPRAFSDTACPAFVRSPAAEKEVKS